MEIDIRNSKLDAVEAIIYANVKNEFDGYKLVLDHDMTAIEAINGHSIYIDTKEDAENLIKALQKAIELGNWSE